MMYGDDDLDAAVSAGAISAEAVRDFRAFIARSAHVVDPVDEEYVRLVSSFNDIFVVLAIALLLGSLVVLLSPVLAAGATALASWALAEFFTRRRGMALASIVLLLAFVASVACVGWFAMVSARGPAIAPALAAAGSLAAMGAWLHWRRFHVPITVGAGVAGVIAACIATVLALLPDAQRWMQPLFFAGGIGAFLLAMRWDMADPARRTRRSDVGFWLHVLAAPLIVRPVFDALAIHGDALSAVAALAVYAALGLVALVVDRRALLVSGLVYALVASSSLLGHGVSRELNAGLAGLLIGSILLLLSSFWTAARSRVVGLLPARWRTHLALVR